MVLLQSLDFRYYIMKMKTKRRWKRRRKWSSVEFEERSIWRLIGPTDTFFLIV